MLGYNRHILWNYRSQYWLWTGTLGPLCEGLVRAFVYDSLLYIGPDTVFNRPKQNPLPLLFFFSFIFFFSYLPIFRPIFVHGSL